MPQNLIDITLSIFEYIKANSPLDLDISFEKDLLKNTEISDESDLQFIPSEDDENLILIDDSKDIVVDTSTKELFEKKKVLNTIEFAYELTNKFNKVNRYCNLKESIMFELYITTEKDPLKSNMDTILKHYIDVIYSKHKGKIPLVYDEHNKPTNYCYLVGYPNVKNVIEKKHDVNKAKIVFEIFYVRS